MSDNKTFKYLKKGLLVTLFATTSISSMAQAQTFEEYKKAKMEQFNKYRMQKKDEMKQNLTPHAVQQQDMTQTVQVDVPEKMDGQEVYLSGIAGGNLGLGLDDINCRTSKDGSVYYFSSSRGVAALNAEGQGMAGVLEKDGNIHYYRYSNATSKKEEVKDAKTKELIGYINQQYGDENSDFSKVLKKEQKTNQVIHQNPQKSQTIQWVKDRYGVRPNIRVDQGVEARRLLPRARYNSQTKLYFVGYISSPDESNARQLAEFEIQSLAAEEKIYQDFQKQAETKPLEQNAQEFLKSHLLRMEKMGLYTGKDGQLHQKANDDTSQIKAKTLDLSSYFINQGGNSQG